MAKKKKNESKKTQRVATPDLIGSHKSGRPVFQGDVAFLPMQGGVPSDAKRKADQIVAHSESGHHHTCAGAAVFEVPGDPTTMYLRLEQPLALIEHHRPHDTHQTFGLDGPSGAVWKIVRQRENTPQGWRQVAD